MNVYSVLNSRAYTWRFAGANKSTNRFEALSLKPISNIVLTQPLRATKITKKQIHIMEKSRRCSKQCYKRTKVSNQIKNNKTFRSLFRMPRVIDGKSIALPKLCVSFGGGLKTIKRSSVSLALIIAIVSFANCVNLGLAYANNNNNNVDAPLNQPLNLIQNVLSDDNRNNSNSHSEKQIYKDSQLTDSESPARQVSQLVLIQIENTCRMKTCLYVFCINIDSVDTVKQYCNRKKEACH